MARPKNEVPSVQISRRIHPAYAERLAQLEAIGLDLEALISIANDAAVTLACVEPNGGVGETRFDYAMGRTDTAAAQLAAVADHREIWVRDWQIRLRSGESLNPLLQQRKDWIDTHVARYRESVHQLPLRLGAEGRN